MGTGTRCARSIRRSLYSSQEIFALAAYGASKAAVHGTPPPTHTHPHPTKQTLPAYAETLAEELRPHNIRVTIVAPGTFATAFNAPPTTAPGTIAAYAPFHAQFPRVIEALRTKPDAGDPARGMDVLVDVVRG